MVPDREDKQKVGRSREGTWIEIRLTLLLWLGH